MAKELHEDPDGAKKLSSFYTKKPHYKVTFEGNLGKNYVTPRGLTSSMVNNLV